uniref:UPAR/Ly6 domain-containing protein n=1 Tax=Steinernema glaseri TaxID=37863 RepID=A0A1I8ALC2_9BILA
MVPVRSASALLCALCLCIAVRTEAQYLWCHAGGANRQYKPAQCPDETVECFKFECKNAQTPTGSFISRGCGVSRLTSATGLANESCFQAQGVCEQLNGQSHCFTCNNLHMCNSSFLPTLAPSLFILLFTLFCTAQ